MHRFILFPILFLLLTGGVSRAETSRENYYRSTRANIKLFEEVYLKTVNNYVDVIDPEPFIREAVDGMLSRLDPYTAFFDEKGTERLRTNSSGHYGGLGMQVGLRGKPKELTVIAPFADTPASRAGIRPGDVILEVDSLTISGMPLDEAVNYMRGEPGTPVRLLIRRPGFSDPLEFHLERALINLKDVQLATLLENQVGYVKLNGFSRPAPQDLEAALEDLLDRGMKSLILDLRGNPGGLLRSAVAIADLFLPRDAEIVSTRGRDGELIRSYLSLHDPVLPPDLPMAVLINQGSASASEIVSGCLQDHDRAVLLGTNSFGKGLVQSIINLPDNNSMKITTARYYIPSGRLIQRIDYFADNPILNHRLSASNAFTDTLFSTEHGRRVISGRGIDPDITVKKEKLSRFTTELWREGKFFAFVTALAATGELDSTTNVDASILSPFTAFLDSTGFRYRSPLLSDLDSLRSRLDDDQLTSPVNEALQTLAAALETENDTGVSEHAPEIIHMLRLETAAYFHGGAGRALAALEDDPVLRKALEILGDSLRYHEILTPAMTGKTGKE